MKPEDYYSRPDLCALAVLERVRLFMADEVARNREQDERYRAGMLSLQESVDELIQDITRLLDTSEVVRYVVMFEAHRRQDAVNQICLWAVDNELSLSLRDADEMCEKIRRLN